MRTQLEKQIKSFFKGNMQVLPNTTMEDLKKLCQEFVQTSELSPDQKEYFRELSTELEKAYRYTSSHLVLIPYFSLNVKKLLRLINLFHIILLNAPKDFDFFTELFNIYNFNPIQYPYLRDVQYRLDNEIHRESILDFDLFLKDLFQKFNTWNFGENKNLLIQALFLQILMLYTKLRKNKILEAYLSYLPKFFDAKSLMSFYFQFSPVLDAKEAELFYDFDEHPIDLSIKNLSTILLSNADVLKVFMLHQLQVFLNPRLEEVPTSLQLHVFRGGSTPCINSGLDEDITLLENYLDRSTSEDEKKYQLLLDTLKYIQRQDSLQQRLLMSQLRQSTNLNDSTEQLESACEKILNMSLTKIEERKKSLRHIFNTDDDFENFLTLETDYSISTQKEFHISQLQPTDFTQICAELFNRYNLLTLKESLEHFKAFFHELDKDVESNLQLINAFGFRDKKSLKDSAIKHQEIMILIDTLPKQEPKNEYYQYFKENFGLFSNEQDLDKFKLSIENIHMQYLMDAMDVNPNPSYCYQILQGIPDEQLGEENKNKIIFLKKIYLNLYLLECIKNTAMPIVMRIIYFLLFFILVSPQEKAKRIQSELHLILFQFQIEGPSDYLETRLEQQESARCSLKAN